MKILWMIAIMAICGCALAVNPTKADDTITINCSDAVDRGMIILDNPPIMNCKDLNLVTMFVGTGLIVGPVSNIDALAEDLEEAAKQLGDQQAVNQSQVIVRKQVAFEELDVIN